MRSSKSRNRNKNNNNRRPSGNIINRVFDSSGPEGKVRGTPQQIIDKYSQLARDAQLAGDRVAVEGFQQHAEHYTRLLSEAMREQAERQAQQDAQQAQANEARRERQESQHNRDRSRDGAAPNDAPKPEVVTEVSAVEAPVPETATGDAPAVEATEERPARKPRARRPRAERKPKAEGEADAPATSETAAPTVVE